MIRRNPTRIELKLDDTNEMHISRKEDEDSEGPGPKDVAVNTDHKNYSNSKN